MIEQCRGEKVIIMMTIKQFWAIRDILVKCGFTHRIVKVDDAENLHIFTPPDNPGRKIHEFGIAIRKSLPKKKMYVRNFGDPPILKEPKMMKEE